jgi:hypothetical protein
VAPSEQRKGKVSSISIETHSLLHVCLEVLGTPLSLGLLLGGLTLGLLRLRSESHVAAWLVEGKLGGVGVVDVFCLKVRMLAMNEEAGLLVSFYGQPSCA